MPQSEVHDQTPRTQLPIYELNCHEVESLLDEIIDENLTNSDIVLSFWASVADHL
jgi:hypothetical protein